MPSEIISRAFFGNRPRAARGTASTTVSYSAVPPFGVRRPSARPISWRSVVQPLQQRRIVAEPVEEHLVLFVEQLVGEPVERRLGFANLVARHAAARVERDAQAHGYPLRVEMRDLDRPVVFEDEEVVLAQPWDESTAGVGHRRRHVDQLDAAAESKRVVGFATVGRRRLLTLERCDQDREQRGDERQQTSRGLSHAVITPAWVRRCGEHETVKPPWCRAWLLLVAPAVATVGRALTATSAGVLASASGRSAWISTVHVRHDPVAGPEAHPVAANVRRATRTNDERRFRARRQRGNFDGGPSVPEKPALAIEQVRRRP